MPYFLTSVLEIGYFRWQKWPSWIARLIFHTWGMMRIMRLSYTHIVYSDVPSHSIILLDHGCWETSSSCKLHQLPGQHNPTSKFDHINKRIIFFLLPSTCKLWMNQKRKLTKDKLCWRKILTRNTTFPS